MATRAKRSDLGREAAGAALVVLALVVVALAVSAAGRLSADLDLACRRLVRLPEGPSGLPPWRLQAGAGRSPSSAPCAPLPSPR